MCRRSAPWYPMTLRVPSWQVVALPWREPQGARGVASGARVARRLPHSALCEPVAGSAHKFERLDLRVDLVSLDLRLCHMPGRACVSSSEVLQSGQIRPDGASLVDDYCNVWDTVEGMACCLYLLVVLVRKVDACLIRPFRSRATLD